MTQPLGIPANDAVKPQGNDSSVELTFDTCPKLPGYDELGNWMTYSAPICKAALGHFTRGQVRHLAWYRRTLRAAVGVSTKVSAIDQITGSDFQALLASIESLASTPVPPTPNFDDTGRTRLTGRDGPDLPKRVKGRYVHTSTKETVLVYVCLAD